jgi:cyclomaltodextrinase
MSKPNWISDAIFYHIYPLGLCGAPPENDGQTPPIHRLASLQEWIPHLESLGINAIYIGPVFESISHGYDTTDYQHIDRRLGSDADFATLVDAFHEKGIRVILDAVFNHVGRQFPAFQDLQQQGQNSPYRDWFSGLDFSKSSPLGDPFTYDTWAGHYSLVKLNLKNPAVCTHLLDAVCSWFERWHIDGLRLDAVDQVDPNFLRQLRQTTDTIHPDAWLMGESVHSDYKTWANPEMIHSITNYECYKGLYSSHNDQNLFEIAYAFNRQSGENGLYENLVLYNFLDNHDVNRIASMVERQEFLNTLYILLYTMPGVPSIYYGSEWGLRGEKTNFSDRDLRPKLDLQQQQANPPIPHLFPLLQQLAGIRKTLPALTSGGYQEYLVQSKHFAFMRTNPENPVLVSINIADQPVQITLSIPMSGKSWVDALHPQDVFTSDSTALSLNIPAYSGRILHLAN